MVQRAMFGALLALAPAAAQATVTFTFDDPATVREVDYAPPISGGGDTTGDVTYAFTEDTSVDLVVDATLDGGVISEFDAGLIFDISVGTATVIGSLLTADIQGSFSFVDPDTSGVILTANFSGGLLFEFGTAGSIVATSMGVGTTLTYTPGPLLTAADPTITGFQQPADAVFTLTNVAFDNPGETTVEVDGETFIAGFSANAAFSGTAFIPGPAAAATLGLGCLAAVRRRRA